jgi:methyl-accepting chemotaxis protein
LGIRGVVPIAQAGKHLGSVEFGLSFGQSFFDEFKRTRGVDVAFHLADKNEFKTFGGTLGGRSFFNPADYRGAGDGGFLIHQDRLDQRFRSSNHIGPSQALTTAVIPGRV